MEGLALERIAAERPCYEFWCGNIGQKTFALVLKNRAVQWYGDELDDHERDGILAELSRTQTSN